MLEQLDLFGRGVANKEPQNPLEKRAAERKLLPPETIMVDEEPIEDRRLRVEEPEEADHGERDRRRPRQEDEEPEQPAAAELVHERVRDQAGADDDDRLRDQCHLRGVPERAAEDRVVQDATEVREADPLAGDRAGGRVREREIDREDERDADERGNEKNGRGDEERREDSPALCDVPEPAASAPPCRGHCRHVWRESIFPPPWPQSSSTV